MKLLFFSERDLFKYLIKYIEINFSSRCIHRLYVICKFYFSDLINYLDKFKLSLLYQYIKACHFEQTIFFSFINFRDELPCHKLRFY